jgi:hypothetical protein
MLAGGFILPVTTGGKTILFAVEKLNYPQGTQGNAEDGRLRRHIAAGLPAVMSERVSGYQEIEGRPSRPPFASACPGVLRFSR